MSNYDEEVNSLNGRIARLDAERDFNIWKNNKKTARKNRFWKICGFGFFIITVAFVLVGLYSSSKLGVNIRNLVNNDILGETSASLSNKLSNAYTLNPYYFNGNWKYYLTGNESKWVADIKFDGNTAIITAKPVKDLTYEECIMYDAKSIYETCLEYKNITYDVPLIMPVKDASNSLISTANKQLSAKSEEYFSVILNPLISEYKIGYGTIYIIQDVSVRAVLEDIVAENNFTHLNISDVSPYDGLVLYMPFDDNISSTKTYDYTKYGNDGTNVGKNWTVTGVYGKAREFNGAGDYIDCGKDLSLNITTFTVSAWFKANIESTMNVIGKRKDNRPFWELMTRPTPFRICFEIGNLTDYIDTACQNIAINEWHYVVGVYDKSTLNASIYYNGNFVDSVSMDYNYIPVNEYLYIGMIRNSFYFNGTIDEVMIFNTALTSAQILAIYNNQSARFKTSGTAIYNITVTPGNNRINVTSFLQNNFYGNISLRLYDNVSNTWTAYQNITNGGDYQFTIGTNATLINLSYKFVPDSYAFYSPIMLNNITINSWISDTTPPPLIQRYNWAVWNGTGSQNDSSNEAIRMGYNETLGGFLWIKNSSNNWNKCYLNDSYSWECIQ